jgi:hypothetical protein
VLAGTQGDLYSAGDLSRHGGISVDQENRKLITAIPCREIGRGIVRS